VALIFSSINLASRAIEDTAWPRERINRPRNKSTFFLQKVRYDFRSLSSGVLAQLVERLNGIEEVRGSNPLGSILHPVVKIPGGCRLAGQPGLNPVHLV
jgi:hypothetical protein